MSRAYRQNLQFLKETRISCRESGSAENPPQSADRFAKAADLCDSQLVHRSHDFATNKGYALRQKVACMIYQGLSFLALAVRTVPGRMARDWRAGMWMAFAPGIFGAATLSADAQENMGNLLPAESSTSVSSEHFQRIQPPPPERGFMTYTFQSQLSDQFNRRDLQFQVISEVIRNQDLGQMRERFGDSMRKKVERSATRTVARYLETTPFVESLKDEPWKERLFNIAKDAVTEETQTLDGQLGDDDPHVDMDFESAVVRKPAWKEKVNFFLRPFSMHPNAGVGLKLDTVRAQIKAYHDEVKFSAVVPITHNWNFYTSARLEKFSTEEASLNFGFQHAVRLLPQGEIGVIQYGVSIKNRSFTDNGRTSREYMPHAFFAFAMDF
jgi:hypothetical protein